MLQNRDIFRPHIAQPYNILPFGFLKKYGQKMPLCLSWDLSVFVSPASLYDILWFMTGVLINSFHSLFRVIANYL